MMHPFQNKIAIVTGGASGIGRALCEELAGRGAVVVVGDLNTLGARQVAESITAGGGRARAVGLDVSRENEVTRVIKDTAAEHGRLDFMFNNAGIAFGGEVRDKHISHWRQTIDVNLWGVIYGSLTAYSLMIEQGFGHIVNTASMAGLMPVPAETAYATTKFAVVGLSTSLRLEGAELGVRVSVVCPGLVRTGIFKAANLINADMDELLAMNPLQMVPAQKAARFILSGVARNKAIIVFPFHARFLWWLAKYCPVILTQLWRKYLRDFRTIRRDR
jgi:NAD(P)-dependent dehydrogenase (short-subunit alcohol dehydrogenase family)